MASPKKSVLFICLGLYMTLNDKCSKHLDSLFMMFILHVNNIEIIVLGEKYAQYIKLVVYVARYFILNL